VTKGNTISRVAAATDFIGLDLSDKTGTYVVISAEGAVAGEGKLKLTRAGLSQVLGARPAAQIAIEVGGQSPWVSRALAELGYTVTVANPRQVKLISQGHKKNDREDAENLARLLRLDPHLLRPVTHRGPAAQTDLMQIRSRDALVRSRTRLINSARNLAKAAGQPLPKCSSESFHLKVPPALAETLKPVLMPLLQGIAGLSEQIAILTRQLEKLADGRYPETRILRQVKGVGPLTSLAFILTLEESQRFGKSRAVGAFLGLTQRQHDSGKSQPQLGITKQGDPFLRRLLIQSAQYILGPFGEDCDLKRWGISLMRGSGNKILKKKAVVAVARKLAVLLHHLWSTGEVYDPHYQATARAEAA
jgi:transposase